MRDLLQTAPGVIWTAVIVGLMLLAEWLSTYFGNVAWIPALAGLLAAVVVPVLKVLAGQEDGPVGLRDVTARQSALNRWLF